jgi:hypothetical protein
VLSVGIDTNNFEPTNITIDTNMAVVVRGEIFVYPVSKPKPTEWQRLWSSDTLDFGSYAVFFHTKQDGIPQADTKYVVEMDLAILETALPVRGGVIALGPSYKIAWQRTLKQVVE